MEILAIDDNSQIPQPLIDDVLNLFADMKMWWKKRMTTGENLDYGAEEAMLWANYLFKAGVSQQEFLTAKNLLLVTSEQGGYPISNPQEFLDLVRRKPYPTARMAFLIATSIDYKAEQHHVVIWEAVKRTGEWELKNNAERYTYPLFRENYKEAVHEFLAGKEFSYPCHQDIGAVSVSPFANMLDNWRKNKQQAGA